MKSKIYLRLRALSLYGFCLVIVFLAGRYIGGYMDFLFYLLLAFPVVSFTLLGVSVANIRHHQEFDTEHPVKGQTVQYTLVLTNESALPNPFVRVRFKEMNPLMRRVLPEFTAYLRSGERLEKTYGVRCPYRGVYTVGLESAEMEDVLHLFGMRASVWHRTFYVYPRIPLLRTFHTGRENLERKTEGLSVAGLPDYSLFKSLKGYRSGESVRHMYWKKFAATGLPYLKEYETTAQPGVTIYFDTRKGFRPGRAELELEDTSVEILVALVKYYLDLGVPTTVRASGRQAYSFHGDQSQQFSEFYNSTLNLVFQDTYSPDRLYRVDAETELIDVQSVFFVTHLLDPAVFGLLEESLSTEYTITMIFNQSGYGEQERERNHRYFNKIRDRGGRILVVNNSDTIVDDLEAGIDDHP